MRTSPVRPPALSRPRLHIDLGAVARNYRFFASRPGAGETGATVKADAYGLGADRIAPVLESAGCRTFFVAHAQEGAALRQALKQPGSVIYVYNGLFEGEEDYFFAHRLRPVLNSLDQIDLWRAISTRAAGGPAAALHIDTGMNRLGLSPEETTALAADPSRLDDVRLSLLMSHLACADDPAHAMNERQRAAFRAAASALPGEPSLSLSNSAGCLLGGEYAFDLTRPGIGLYGGNPLIGAAPDLSPVVSIAAPILQARDLKAGDPVGYGATFTAPSDMRAVTVALGYADGYLRAGAESGFGTLNGVKLPIIGRVSMDLIVLDASGAADAARPGARVSFFGADLEAQADAAGTLSYELLTLLGGRFHRIYEDG